MGDWFNRRLGNSKILSPGADANPTLRQGSKGAAVSKWQAIIGVKADGNFGPGTKSATATWQKSHGLTPDGVVGAASWAAAGGSGGAASSSAPAPSTAPAKAPTSAARAPAGGSPTLRQGMKDASTGGSVSRMQTIVGASPVDGNFGPGTTKAVKAWQAAHGLKADGVFGVAAWNLSANAPATTPTTAVIPPNAPASAPPVNIPTPTLRSGMTDAQTRGAVTRWQGILVSDLARGLDVDGRFGPSTIDQTKLFQKQYGLTPDGVVGAKTWAVALSPHKPAPSAPDAGVSPFNQVPITATAVTPTWAPSMTSGSSSALTTAAKKAESSLLLWVPIMGLAGLLAYKTIYPTGHA